MRPRAATLAGLAAAAMLLALPGCKKAGSGDAGDGPAEPPARSVAGLLDYTARETARIVGASSDRPANLDRMLVAMGQPDPNALWLARLRTSEPFECRTQTATMVRCVAALSRVGEDGIAGQASVMMYDHDIAIADLLADRGRFDPPTTEQTVETATVPMYNPASDGSYDGPYSTCRQAIGSSGNGAATCFTLIGSRTALWARLDPDPASALPASTPSIRPNIIVAALDMAIKQLRTVEVAPDGSFSVGGLPVHGPKMAFTRAGWYARNRELFIKDLLFAGPYDDETSCQMDLPRANLAYQQFHRSARMTVEGCAYYDSTPVGL